MTTQNRQKSNTKKNKEIPLIIKLLSAQIFGQLGNFNVTLNGKKRWHFSLNALKKYFAEEMLTLKKHSE